MQRGVLCAAPGARSSLIKAGLALLAVLVLAALAAPPAVAAEAPPLPRALLDLPYTLGLPFVPQGLELNRLGRPCNRCYTFNGYKMLGDHRAMVVAATYDMATYLVTVFGALPGSREEVEAVITEKYLNPYRAHLVFDRTKSNQDRALCFRDQKTSLRITWGKTGFPSFTLVDRELVLKASGKDQTCE